jgi:mRNA-degrading endonuclease toxin of MazEF toxin-antitoxin module
MRTRLPSPGPASVRRGEIWRYEAKGPRGARLVVIVSGDGINADERRGWLVAVEIVPDDTGDLLAVPVPGHGWADASSVARVYRRWLAERVDVLDAGTAERVDSALRAALDL